MREQLVDRPFLDVVLLIAMVGLAGGLGSALRYLTSVWVPERIGDRYPLATGLVNVVGSGTIGAAAGAGLGQSVAGIVVMGGFLGGLTTFSAASLETVEFWQERKRWVSVLSAVGMMLVCTAAAVTMWRLVSH